MPDPIATATDFIRLLEAQVDHHLGEVQLTLSRYATLSRAEGALAVDIARELGVSEQMVSKTVKELKLLRYVAGIPSTDRRRKLLQVTFRGQTALDQACSLNLPPDLLAAMATYVAKPDLLNRCHPSAASPGLD